MKLLLDENLSVRLVAQLAAHYPGTQHVSQLNLQGASDITIWEAARDGGFVLVSKDDDFRHIALVRGTPPKVVILRIGNASTDAVVKHLLDHGMMLEMFNLDPNEALLVA